MAVLDPIGVDTTSGISRRKSNSDLLSGIGYFMGGSIVFVDPTAPNAADDNDPKTPFVTIQAAIDACPQYGIVQVAPGDYAENLVLDNDVAITGMTNQFLTGWSSGYFYNSGRIHVPSTATGTYFVLNNVYLENNDANLVTIKTDKQVYFHISNSTVYNNDNNSGSHAIYHTAGASSLFSLYRVDLTSSAAASKSFKSDVALQQLLVEESYIYGDSDIAGYVYATRCFLGRLGLTSGPSEFFECSFGDYGANTSLITCSGTASDITLNSCEFYGNSTYIVTSSVSLGVLLSYPRFGRTQSGDTGFKTVGGSATLYRLDCNGETLLNRVKGISGTSVATTTLLNTFNDSSYRLVVTKVILRLASATGLTGTMAAGVGVAAGEDDIFESTTLDNWTSVDDIWVFNSIGKTRWVPANSSVKLGVDTAFGGTVTFDAEIHGYVVRL